MACVCGHEKEKHYYIYGHCDVENCECVGYESDLMELVERYLRPLDEDLINEPFICYLLCGVTWDAYRSLDFIH